jgi:hypothetical protein
MEQIRNSDLIEGKTIQRTDYLDNKFFLFFTDNTFCIISGCGWDERDVEFNEDKFEVEPNTSNYDDLKSIGIIDEATFFKFKDIKEQKNKEYRKQQEIKQLNELRKKYPDA